MRRHYRILASCAWLGLVVAGPLAAQQAPIATGGPPDQEPATSEQRVTVVGEREEQEEAERRREAARFFDSHAVRTRTGQLARWHEPICVRSWGLPPELNAQIAIRVMDIAEDLGVATNRAELCKPNVRIGFTSDPQQMIQEAYQRNRVIIGFHYASQTNAMMRVRQPVQAWYVTTTRSRPSSAYGAANSAETIDQVGVETTYGKAGSRLSSDVSSGLGHVLIFADINAVEGEDAAPLAELIAFLALAQTPVAETCDESDTILNLMNPACPPSRRPTELTRQDIAYLRALYSMNPTSAPQRQRGKIVVHMADTMGGDQ